MARPDIFHSGPRGSASRNSRQRYREIASPHITDPAASRSSEQVSINHS